MNIDSKSENQVKNIEAGSLAADVPLKGILNWVLNFAGKDPKNDNNDDKKDDKKNDFDPKKFFNENKDKSVYAILALIAVLMYYGDDVRESMGLYQKITFQELGDMVNQNKVSRIKI